MKINHFLLALPLFAACTLCAQPTYVLADTVLAKRYLEEAKALITSAKYDAALGKLDTAMVIYEQVLGKENAQYSAILNQKGGCLALKADFDHALDLFQKALEIRLKVFDPEHPLVADSYNNLGLVYYNKGDYDPAIEYHQKALAIRLKRLGPEHSDVANSYNNLGNANYSKGNYDRAFEYHQKALEIRLKKFGPEHIHVANSCNNIGLLYYRKGDYDRAIEYHQKALEIRLKKFGPEHSDVANSYNNLGNVNEGKGDYDRAIEYHQKALEIRLKKFGSEQLNVANSFNNLGIAYYSKGDYDRAIEYYQKALEIWLKKSGAEHLDVAISYTNLGAVYYRKGDYDHAIEYHQKALEIQLKKFSIEHPDVADSYINLGILYYRKGDYDRAIGYHQKALEIRLKKFSAEHPDVAVAYYNLGVVYKSKGDYTQAANYFKKASSYITDYRKNVGNPSSKSTLTKELAEVYEGGIATNHLLYQRTDSTHYLYKAFAYAEQSKALSLYESMKNTDAMHLAGIPDSLLQKERDLRVDIVFYEKRRQDLSVEGKGETDSIVLNISGKLFDLNRSYEALIDTFEIRYPDYYRLKYDLRTEDVPSIQSDLLQPDQALLEYYVGDSSVFIFLVKKDDYHVIEFKKDFPLEDWARQLRHGISGYHTDTLQPGDLYESTSLEYAEAARLLYEKLLAPVDSLLPQRVVIVPDGVLGYIPFEALLPQKPVWWKRFDTYPYFGLKHDISYCYSATLLREMVARQHRREPSGAFLAIAPKFDGDTSLLNARRIDSDIPANKLPNLKYAKEEALELSRLMGGKAIVGKEATEDAFAHTVGQYGIVHLATHGKANDQSGDYSFLAFTEVEDSLENEWLYVREVYNLSLNADMVVLSACETGIGEWKRGEGIISLARAFAYAGAKSIVSSLWSVDDARTKELMIRFYQNLLKGMAKDAALAEARRAYLTAHKGEHAHPWFWAGFVAIGDMGAVER